MIFDSLNNIAVYRSLSPTLRVAIDFLAEPSNHTLPLGRHAIDGDRVFAIAMSYETKRPQETFWEAHQKFIDVQYIVHGVEAMSIAPIELMRPVTAYDPEKDFTKFEGAGQQLIVPAGHFAIFWPHDVHMPSLAVGAAATVRKIVVKAAVE